MHFILFLCIFFPKSNVKDGKREQRIPATGIDTDQSSNHGQLTSPVAVRPHAGRCSAPPRCSVAYRLKGRRHKDEQLRLQASSRWCVERSFEHSRPRADSVTQVSTSSTSRRLGRKSFLQLVSSLPSRTPSMSALFQLALTVTVLCSSSPPIPAPRQSLDDSLQDPSPITLPAHSRNRASSSSLTHASTTRPSERRHMSTSQSSLSATPTRH